MANILPKEEELKFQQALELLQDQRYTEALPLLKSAWEMTDKKNSDFALLYAETYIAMKSVEEAREILKAIRFKTETAVGTVCKPKSNYWNKPANRPNYNSFKRIMRTAKPLKLRLNWQISYTKLIKMKKHSRYFLIG